MEALIVIVVIAVGLVLLGVSLAAIAKGLLIIAAVVLSAMLVFFAVMCVFLLLSKPASGEFDGFESGGEEQRFETAYYKVGEQRLKNIFPAENILRKRIYSSGAQKLRRIKLGENHFAIDRHSMVIILLGLAATVPSLIFVISMIGFMNRISKMLG